MEIGVQSVGKLSRLRKATSLGNGIIWNSIWSLRNISGELWRPMIGTAGPPDCRNIGFILNWKRKRGVRAGSEKDV